MGGSDSTETNVDDIIDQALGTPTVENNDSSVTPPVENQSQESTETSDSSNEAGQTTDSGNAPENQVADGTENSAEDNQNEPEEKDAKIAKLEQELADAKAKIETLETEAIDAQSQIETLTKTAEDARNEANNFKQRCVALATANKEAVVDGIVSKETFDNEDSKAERVKDLMMKSMKELKQISSDAKQNNVQRTMASVQSPCLAIEDESNDSTKATDTDTKTDNQKMTVEDAAQEVIKRLFK